MVAVDCGSLLPPLNGWLYGSETTYPHRLLFSCNRGYSLVGPSQIMCMNNGSWSQKQPSCIGRSRISYLNINKPTSFLLQNRQSDLLQNCVFVLSIRWFI